ncbi:MAG: ABC transporter permease subunit [Candidatus Latescibacteria bacterium]|nr:ABC transporter permease subunit [bacterium]MBD3424020.1 ABC transporter permease subunit [Candidatus Latescibacterota bacterium]
MKILIEVIKKEFLHIIRDPRTLIIILGIPVAQILLFGYVITNEIKDAGIAIYDKSGDHVTARLTGKILSSGYFHLVRNISSVEEIDQSFQSGNIREVVVFGEEFAEKLGRGEAAPVQIITDASEPNTARLMENYTLGIINSFSRELYPGSAVRQPVSVPVRMLFNPELKSVFMFVPGVMALLLTLISAMITSLSITREKEQGTMEMLLVSPFRPFHLILGKVLPYVIISLINAVVIIILANTVFGLPVRGNLVLLLAECLLFVTTALSMGIFISTITGSQLVAMMISMVGLMMPTMLLSGFIYPIRNMPRILQLVTNIIPARWFIVIIKSVMIKGTGFGAVMAESAVLAGMTLLFLGFSVLNFNQRLQ